MATNSSFRRYGGIFERGSKEYTLDDFYALPLDKMDKYLCLKKSDVVIPIEGEEESSSDEDDDEDDDEDGEDEDDEAEGSEGDETPETLQPEASKKHTELETSEKTPEPEEKEEGKEEDVSRSHRFAELELITVTGPTSQSDSVLGGFKRYRQVTRGCDQHATPWGDVGHVLCPISYAPHQVQNALGLILWMIGEHWAQKAFGTSDNRGKLLRRDGFALAEERYGMYTLGLSVCTHSQSIVGSGVQAHT